VSRPPKSAPVLPAAAKGCRLPLLACLLVLLGCMTGCLDRGTGESDGPGPVDAGVCSAEDPADAPSDSAAWTRALRHGPFPARMRANLAVFGDRLWLLGGAASEPPLPGSILRDAWSTADGRTWRREADTLPFGPILEFKVAVHGGELWALTTRIEAEAFANDVWKSSDGAAWTRVAADAIAFRWGGNRGSAFASYGGRLWSIWGSPLAGSGESAVQTSADGQTWRIAAGSPLSGGLQRAGAAALGGSLWILGGDGTPNAAFYTDQSWRIDDAAWTNVPSDTGVLPRFDFALAGHADALWVIGGVATGGAYDPEGARADEVWRSPDGARWELADAHAPFGRRAGAASASFRGRLWIVGGYRPVGGAAPSPLDDVWCR